MKKKENKWLETLEDKNTILLKKSFLLAMVPKTEDKTIQRVILNILKDAEESEETKTLPDIELSIGVIRLFVTDLATIPAYAYKPSETYYQQVFEDMTYEERIDYKEAITTKTCTNCTQEKCPFFHSSNNLIDCHKWHNPCLIGKQYSLKKLNKPKK